MGNCIVSTLSVRNSFSVVPHPDITTARKVTQVSVEIEDGGVPLVGESRIRRSLSAKDLTRDDMWREYQSDNGRHISILSMLLEVLAEAPDRTAMAFRPVDRIEEGVISDDLGGTKPWTFIHLKPTVLVTRQQLRDRLFAFGSGLIHLGVQPGSRLALFEETRSEWLIAADGSWTQNVVPMTVYANLGEDALLYAIKEALPHALLCNGKNVRMIHELCQRGGIETPILIFTDSCTDEPADLKNNERKKLIAFDELLRLGRENPAEPTFPSSHDAMALIMYTSGTTGEPKGVMFSHGNLISCVKGWTHALETALLPRTVPDTHVAYLPLAHILEFAAEHIMLLRGTVIGYANPKTLTNSSARPHGDLQEFRPAFLVGVPRIFETVKKAIEAKIPRSGVAKAVFDRAFQERLNAIRNGEDTPYWNEKVFKGPRDLFGGRLRCVFTGGAPISGSTQTFLEVVLGASVCQGYALTESCCGFTQRYYQSLQVENVGGPLRNVEIKLRRVDGWNMDGPTPAGEVCFRGPTVTQGYYKQPELTKQAFGDDGWFASGDVGQFQTDGSLKVVGRVKSLAKNAFGEYIALEALECIYVTNELAVPNGVCLLVEPTHSYVAAIMLTDQPKATNFAQAHQIQGEWPHLLEDPAFLRAAVASLERTAKNHHRKPFEFIKKVAVLADEWTPENGVLTAAMKLKRRAIAAKYATVIHELFPEEH